MLRHNTETYSCNHRVHFVWGPSFFLFSYFYEVFSRVMKVMKHFFSQCSVSCGKGFKFRDVHCLDSFQAKTEEGNCRHLKKPRTYKICRAGRCPAWKTSSWKEVGKICCKFVVYESTSKHIYDTLLQWKYLSGRFFYMHIAIRSTRYQVVWVVFFFLSFF